MKKIDKLILTSFLGPFILTFLVVVFILLTQHMLKYFDDIIGKDLGWGVLGTLLFYFAIFMTPVAMPLAVLLSSLITFGNLGEHFELTAVKSLGISLVRSLVPIFGFVLILTGIAFWANNNLVPKAALEAYSLLYDIKQKKPALDLREGAFYSAIPDINIKVNDKLPDGKTLRGVIIYDHRGKAGNKDVIVADSGKMYTILNDQYLKLELFKGFQYVEGTTAGEGVSSRQTAIENLRKTKFSKMQVVFDLSSFGLNRTDKKWFQGNRIMRNMTELDTDMDSVRGEINTQKINIYKTKENFFTYHFRRDTLKLPSDLEVFSKKKDSLTQAHARAKTGAPPVTAVNHPNTSVVFAFNIHPVIDEKAKAKSDSLFKLPVRNNEVVVGLNSARMMKSQLLNATTIMDDHDFRFKEFQIQWHKILANSLACIVMFLIGAPLGAIIKKGGLGIPVLVSIFFFIVFYLLTMIGEKWAKQGTISVPVGIWTANVILLIIGLLFLRQARADARLFDADFYNVAVDKLKTWFSNRKVAKSASA
jgi:lipopolysaccharide export system permease protein